jgi:hypothetical protein
VKLYKVSVSLVDEPRLARALEALNTQRVLDVVPDVGLAKLFELHTEAGPVQIKIIGNLDVRHRPLSIGRVRREEHWVPIMETARLLSADELIVVYEIGLLIICSLKDGGVRQSITLLGRVPHH